MRLNAILQRFVDEYLKDSNATQAAIRAGYSKKTAKSIGQRLLTFVDVKKSIKKAQQSLSERTEITQEKVIEKLEGIANKAEKKGNYNAAARCWELIGTNIGMFKKNLQLSTKDDKPLEIVRVVINKSDAETST